MRRLRRSASSTPRRWIPTRTRSSVPAATLDDLGGHAREGPAERAFIEEESPGGHRGGKLVTGYSLRNSTGVTP